MEDDYDGIVYMPGNEYKEGMIRPFLSRLRAETGKPVIFVQLLENKSKKLDYDQLDPKSYSDYIAKSIGKPGKYVMIGISMGCLHIANFSHFYPNWCYNAMIMIEPTIMQGIYPLLHTYEAERGNGEWLEDLKAKPNNLNIPANEKVMDMSIDKHYQIPSKIQIGVVYTSRSNTDQPYTAKQIAAKNKYYKYLQSKHKTYLLHLDTSHCVDMKPKYFNTLIDFIIKVIHQAQ